MAIKPIAVVAVSALPPGAPANAPVSAEKQDFTKARALSRLGISPPRYLIARTAPDVAPRDDLGVTLTPGSLGPGMKPPSGCCSEARNLMAACLSSADCANTGAGRSRERTKSRLMLNPQSWQTGPTAALIPGHRDWTSGLTHAGSGCPVRPAIRFSAQIRAISLRVWTVALAICGATTQFGNR